MVKTIIIDNTTYHKIRDYYASNETTPPNYAKFAAKNNEYSIIVYNSNKVVFQGKKALEEANKWIITQDALIGSDEVGKGDFFGPLVVCSVYLDSSYEAILNQYQVSDSKKISDDKIIYIAQNLIDKIPHYVTYCSVEKYNQYYQQGLNVNQILSHLHYEATKQMQQKYDVKIIIDGFTTIELFKKYLNNKPMHNLTLETKAEDKYLAVAVASILARYYFLQHIKQLNTLLQELGVNETIQLGASSLVDEQAKRIFTKIGYEYTNQFIKLNFKNSGRIK